MVHQLDYSKYTFADLTFMVSQYSGCLTINKTHLIFSLSIFFTTMKCCVELISFFLLVLKVNVILKNTKD